MRTITITLDGSGFDVHEDGKCCDGLSWDEMLGQVAMLTIPISRVGNGFAMHTPQEWAVIRAKSSAKVMEVLCEAPTGADKPIQFHPV